MNANKFEDQNKEALDAELKVAAMLRDLKRVSAPADFDARLRARLSAAKVEEREFGGIKGLLADLPLVAAPADFDFRVRARIASARAGEQSGGWWSWLRVRNFSFAQASAALLVVAFAASGLTYKLLHVAPAAQISPDNAIASSSSPRISKAVDSAVAVPRVVERAASETPARVADLRPPVSQARNRSTLVVPAVSRPRDVVSPVSEAASESVSEIAASGTVMIKHAQDGSARMVNTVSYGLQSAVARQSLAKSAREDVATQIF